MLYTEMISSHAVLRGGRGGQAFDASQHPLGLQLGGSEPQAMAECAAMAEQIGYDEVNINVGCPSSSAAAGSFGACLMLSPHTVADCIAAMSARVTIPITVKCRIGVEQGGYRPRSVEEDRDAEAFSQLCRFTKIVSQAGCAALMVHARRAILGGLNPRQNRRIPKLHYDWVRALKREFPDLEIILNGGLTTLEQAQRESLGLDGVMVGRALYRNPMLLAEVDAMFYGEKGASPPLTRQQIVEQYLDYLRGEIKGGAPTAIARHLAQWFHGKLELQRLLDESQPLEALVNLENI